MSNNHFQESKVLFKNNFKNYSYGLIESWDKTKFNLFLTISKMKDSKNVAVLSDTERVPLII